MLISENLPRRAGFPPTPGRAAERFDWTPGGRQLGAGRWELGGGSRDRTGSREAREIRVLNHWAAGLRSRLLPEVCDVATPEMCPKSVPKIWRFALWFWCVVPGNVFLNGFGGVLPGVAELFCYRFASKLSHGRRVIRQNRFRKSENLAGAQIS